MQLSILFSTRVFPSSGGWEGLSFAFGVLDLPPKPTWLVFPPLFVLWPHPKPYVTGELLEDFPHCFVKKEESALECFHFCPTSFRVISVACCLFAHLATTYLIVY